MTAPAPDASRSADTGPSAATDALADVKQLPLAAAIASLGYVFWVCGGMEMVERLAYFGVKAVATLYAKDPVSRGGLGVDLARFGNLLMVWALIQSIVPVFTGGLSDRYGYKRTIFASTIVKIAGYLTMAFFPSYAGFFAGVALLATGTAIFKPGIQGTLARTTTRQNSSVAWGIFYQTVNIGGWIGPLIAGLLRKLAWRNVFFACAAAICMNFVLLLTYKEPRNDARLSGEQTKRSLVADSLHELRKPHVWTYLAIFSGFWFMFMSLFDVLPPHLEDWVDTRPIVQGLLGAHASPGPLVRFFIDMNRDATEVLPEGMINIDSILIMLTCFLFAGLSAKMRATTSMLLGTLLASVAMFLCGQSTLGWTAVLAIAVFAVGEMLSAPKFSEYIGNFAPDDKKAMYLGFSQMSLAVGWTLEGKIGPWLYDHYASKERFAREALRAHGLSVDAVRAIPEGEAFQRLLDVTHGDRWTVTAQLAANHHVSVVWYVMAAIGVFSAIGIALYGRWVGQSLQRRDAPAP